MEGRTENSALPLIIPGSLQLFLLLFGMDSGTQESKGPGVNKRMWTEDKESKLIKALLGLKNSGKYNADGGFKPGHFTTVEKLLAVSLSNSGLKVDPHIKLRIKALKSHFAIVHDMISGHNTSGFGFADTKKCVVAEKSVLDPYLKGHKRAVQFKNKQFCFYRELCIIFEKDRATRKDAETPADVLEELDKEYAQTENDNEFYGMRDDLDGNDISTSFKQSATIGNTSEVSSKKKRKHRSESVENMIYEVMEKSTTIMNSTMEKATNQLSRAIEDAMRPKCG